MHAPKLPPLTSALVIFLSQQIIIPDHCTIPTLKTSKSSEQWQRYGHVAAIYDSINP